MATNEFEAYYGHTSTAHESTISNIIIRSRDSWPAGHYSVDSYRCRQPPGAACAAAAAFLRFRCCIDVDACLDLQQVSSSITDR